MTRLTLPPGTARLGPCRECGRLTMGGGICRGCIAEIPLPFRLKSGTEASGYGYFGALTPEALFSMAPPIGLRRAPLRACEQCGEMFSVRFHTTPPRRFCTPRCKQRAWAVRTA